MTDTVVLHGRGLTLSALTAVAGGARVQASPEALSRVGAAHAAATQARSERRVYGHSTGVGAVRGQAVAPGGDHALRLLRSHAAGWGDVLPAELVRAALAVRVNQLLVGGSGARPELVAALLDLVDGPAPDLPVVHRHGSLGTGDLTALAEVGLALAGERPRRGGGSRRDLELTDEDALPLMSSNAFAIAETALAADALLLSAQFATVTCALSFLVLQGNPEAYDHNAATATPYPGAQAVMGELRRLLDGQPLEPRHIQDFFGLRTWPQVHGPLVDALDQLTRVVETAANTASENPLFTDGARGAEVSHHGGFHAAYLALAVDTTLLALARSGQAVQSRISHQLTDRDTGLPLFLADGVPGSSGLLIAEYVAASALSVIREAASAPTAVQTTHVSSGIEDDASFVGLAGARLDRAARAHRRLVATELVCAVRALRVRGTEPRGALAEVWERCRALPDGLADRDLGPDLDAAEAVVTECAAPVG